MIFQTSHAMSNVNMMIFEKHSMREKKCIEYDHSKYKSIYRYTLEQSVFIKTISHDNHMANGVRMIMVFNATFNNISVISWRSVLLVEETAGLEENHRLVAGH